MRGHPCRIPFIISILVLICAVILASWGFPKIVRTKLKESIQLDDQSAMFKKWLKMPMPLTFKIYVFNVTNVDEIMQGARPKLAEVGPYVYEQYRERTVLGYGENDTIRYMLNKTFYYSPDNETSLSEEDEVTVINLPYMGALLTIHDRMPAMVGMVNDAFTQLFTNLTDPFLRVKVKDLFFDGVFMNCATNSSENPAAGLVCSILKSDPPSTLRPSEDSTGFYFSMFSHMNITASGPYEMIRGTENIQDLGRIVSYKDKRAMSNWDDEYCGQLNGTDSTIFAPISDDNVPERLYTFEPEICRSLYATLSGKRSIFNMSAYYYEISSSALAAKSANPDNKCFCRRNWSANHDGCLIMGVLNLQPCQKAPAIASLPHFYLGSEELLEFFSSGVKPDKEKHNSFVYLDPVTGVVLKGSRKLQFNIELRNIKGIPQLEDVPTGLFPILWIDEGAELNGAVLEELKMSHKLISNVEIARWTFLGASIVLMIICAAVMAVNGGLPMFKNRNSVSFIMSPSHHIANSVGTKVH